MTVFEMVFSLLVLVLGLSLVEVLSGLTRCLNARSEVHVGWLTPLLGIWVIGDVTTFWGIAWEVRDLLRSVWPSLGVGVALTSVYYVAASMVFPRDVSAQPDLDAHFWQNRRTVVGLVMACNVAVWVLALANGARWPVEIAVLNGLYLTAGIAAMIARSWTGNTVTLCLLIAILAWNFASQ